MIPANWEACDIVTDVVDLQIGHDVVATVKVSLENEDGEGVPVGVAMLRMDFDGRAQSFLMGFPARSVSGLAFLGGGCEKSAVDAVRALVLDDALGTLCLDRAAPESAFQGQQS